MNLKGGGGGGDRWSKCTMNTPGPGYSILYPVHYPLHIQLSTQIRLPKIDCESELVTNRIQYSVDLSAAKLISDPCLWLRRSSGPQTPSSTAVWSLRSQCWKCREPSDTGIYIYLAKFNIYPNKRMAVMGKLGSRGKDGDTMGKGSWGHRVHLVQ